MRQLLIFSKVCPFWNPSHVEATFAFQVLFAFNFQPLHENPFENRLREK